MSTNVSALNYLSLELIERLDVKHPTEQQIKLIEQFIKVSILDGPVFFHPFLDDLERKCLIDVIARRQFQTDEEVKKTLSAVMSKLNASDILTTVKRAIKIGGLISSCHL